VTDYKKTFFKLDFPIWLAFLIMIGLGWALKANVQKQMITFTEAQNGFRIQYPAAWIPNPDSAYLIEVQDPFATGGYATSITVRRTALNNQNLTQLLQAEVNHNTEQLPAYRMLKSKQGKIAGKEAASIEYAYVNVPKRQPLIPDNVADLPVIVKGTEIIVPSTSFIYYIDFRGTPENLEKKTRIFSKILEGVQL